MKKVFKILVVLVVLALLVASGGYLWFKNNYMVHIKNPAAAVSFKMTGNQTLDAIGRGVEFLTAYQDKRGAFVEGKLATGVEFTALALQALQNIPEDFLKAQDEEYRKSIQRVIKNGTEFIRKSGPKEDGGIYTSLPRFSFGVYGTAICLTTLRELGTPESDPVVQNAQKYLLSAQHNEKGIYKGGFGYNQTTRPDLSNTYNVMEALAASGMSKDDPAFAKAVEFVSNCQNRSESNTTGMALTDDGGFFYKPDLEGKGRGARNVKERAEDGRPIYASYGTMSYAGLVSFLYADVDKNDGRVKSAWNWIQKNYNLDENVNRGQIGLYYYYRIMAKALDKYNQKIITTPDGKKHDWAKEMAMAMIKAQQPDGSWINSNKTFMEDDKILVTSYALGVLEICYKQMK